jgi:hypothetical protein
MTKIFADFSLTTLHNKFESSMIQLGIPVKVSLEEVGRKRTLGAAIALCADAAGLDPKEIQSDLRLDKAQWSRWESGAEGVIWPKLQSLMDRCGNDAPLLWMIEQRGYDLHSLRKVETDTERRLRVSDEALQAERAKNKVLLEALSGRAA